MRRLTHKITLLSTSILLLSIGALVTSRPAHAALDGIAADGSCSVNTNWEQGKSKVWYIELQREGQDCVIEGIAQENDAEIRLGLTAFDWGFARQASDGSFPGTSDPFHSTSMFIESAAYTTLQLESYHPKTYTPDSSFYAQKIAEYTAGCNAAANWLMEPAVLAQGKANDQPYTSRRYIVAALFGEISELTGNSAFADDAVPFVQDALSAQWPDGVNPEQGGYDTEYQEAGVLNAAHYYKTIQFTNPTLAKQVNNMMKKAMVWETKRININGKINTAGCTRVGVETNRDGSVKTMDVPELEGACFETVQETRSEWASTAYQRLMWAGKVPSTAVVASDGSCDYNTAWELGQRAKWAVVLQRPGVAYVEYGIAREDDAAIRKGLSIIDWTFAQQTSNGSFVGTSAEFVGGAEFLESASRAMLDLENYSPVTYTPDSSFYGAEIAKDSAACLAFANWMNEPANATAGEASSAASASTQYCVAAALQETGVLAGDASLETDALSSLTTGLSLLALGGVDQESGTFNLNDQAMGTGWACYYLDNGGDSGPAAASVKSMIVSSLDKESAYVTLTGSILSASPDSIAIQAAFSLGYQDTDNKLFGVVGARLTSGLTIIR